MKTSTTRTAEVKAPFAYQLNQDILNLVWLERLRQKQLFRVGKLGFECASPIVSSDRKLRALTEEIGEVARAIDAIEAIGNVPLEKRHASVTRFLKAQAHLREELIQVASVAIAWLESLEGKQ